MSYIMVDGESDARCPIPGDYSMSCFGAVVVREGLTDTSYGGLRTISDNWNPRGAGRIWFQPQEDVGLL